MSNGSSAPWIGSLPASWSVQRAKTVLYRAKELNSGRVEKQVLSLTLRGVVENDPENPEGLVPEDYATYQLFEADDLVFKLIDLENVRTSRVGLVPKRGIMSSAYLRLRPRPGVCVRYLYWSFFDLYNRQIFNHLGSGVRSTLGADDLLNLPLPMPNTAMQRAIADYLDTETARIDALIAKKQRMIELLEQRSVALAHSAITGVRVAGPRSASRLPWLGDLPVGWKLPPVGSQFQVMLGRMLNADRAVGEDLRPYIRNVNVRWDRVDVEDLAKMDFPPNEQPKYRLRDGDLLINEGGAGVGRAAIWRGEVKECYFQKSVLRLRPVGHTLPEWMIECMRVAVAQKVPLVEGNLATIPHLPAEALRVWRLPMPDRDTQVAQLEWLSRARRRHVEIQRGLVNQIELLREHRQALITAAVTGELEVPGVAA